MTICEKCASPVQEEDRFCGECGTPLSDLSKSPPKPESVLKTCACGAQATSIDADGFCSECGRKQDAADPRDHNEFELSPDFAAVTDRGRRHARNEDAVLVAEFQNRAEIVRLVVVSDGVSSSYDPQEASARAVETLRDAAFAALHRGSSLLDAMKAGVDAAQNDVCAIPYPSYEAAPAATLVAALTCKSRIILAWAGDSRAYFIARNSRQLTRDDSWLNAVIDAKEMTEDQAKTHRYAHAITSCLGHVGDSETPFTPHFIELENPEGAALLLCSDGFWNYAETPQLIAELVTKNGRSATAREICRTLVEHANAAGGHDNISVAMLRTKT